MAEMLKEKNKDAEKEKNTATLSKISNAIKGSEKLDVEGTDLLELLSHLEGELQGRDVAIAALGVEKLSCVLYGCYNGSWKPGNPQDALQRDRYTGNDCNAIDDSLECAEKLAETQIKALQNVVEKQRVSSRKMATYLRESERQRTSLVRELDEEKAKHEHDTAQGDDITYELEKERIRLRQDLEVEVAERQKLEVAVKESGIKMEEEKAKQKQIVLVLLADRKKLMKLYVEEKKRSEDLAQILAEEKGKMETMAAGLEEESKRSLVMEAELEKHMTQFGSERQQLRDKLGADERRYRDMEEALRKARSDVEHFKKQLAEAHRVAMSQAGPPPAYPGPAVTQPPLTQPPSVSPTPLPPTRHPQPSYANFSNYSTYGQVPAQNPTMGPSYTTPGTVGGRVGAVTTARPPGLSPGGHPVIRSQSGPIPSTQAGTAVSQQQQQTHTIKFHPNAYNNSTTTAGNFGMASHPALIPAAGAMIAPMMDQELMANLDINTYSQLGSTKSSVSPKPLLPQTTVPTRKPVTDPSSVRKPVIDPSSVRKPALGKGVPPPVPPNKPVVPVKRGGAMDTGKDLNLTVEGSKALCPPGSSSTIGLQGLKFGLSISSSDTGKGLKELADSHPGPMTNVPQKKFFNNIESKS